MVSPFTMDNLIFCLPPIEAYGHFAMLLLAFVTSARCLALA